MTPQELKVSILQLAIQGKLIEQRPEEGTGAELLAKILATTNTKGTKKNSHAESRSRGERAAFAASSSPSCPVSPSSPVPPADAPFDIPESWVWVRLGEVVSNHGQKKPTGDFSYIDIGSIDNKNQRLSDSETIVHAENASPRARKIVQKGDVIYATVRPYLHNVCVIDREFSREPIASTGFAVMACADCLDNKYLFYFLLSPDFDRYANSSENAKGVAYPAISDKRLYNAPIPLPPLAEQKRIVAKIEELLPYIDRYEKAWSNLEDFNKRFPGDMQKSLLQMAIQGKLVDQRPEEGTGEELYRRLKTYHRGLKPCKDELNFASMDFEIPENWKMIELNQLFDFVDYRGKTPTKASEGVFLVTASNIKQAYMDYTRKEYISHEEYEGRQSRGLTQRGDLLFTTEAPMGNAALCDLDECSCGQRIITFKEYADCTALPALYVYFILSPQFQQQLLDNCTGTTAKGIKADKLKHFLIPLPPYAEQKRIVAKLEELLPLCERLK